MKIFKLGCGFMIFGILLFIVSISIFTYNKKPFFGMQTIGELALIFWIPTIFFGLLLMLIDLAKKDKK